MMRWIGNRADRSAADVARSSANKKKLLILIDEVYPAGSANFDSLIARIAAEKIALIVDCDSTSTAFIDRWKDSQQ
jgi:ABC-type branched-subunit amino acid transport system substrate-binding protein